MITEISINQILKQLTRQLDMFFILSEREREVVKENIEIVIDRCEKCFAGNSNKYYWKMNDTGITESYFNPYHSAQYTIFLYYFSNTIFKIGNKILADKIYYLNKIMNGCDIYHEVELPDIFSLDHPVGSVIGRAKYENNFTFGQNCTVGNNKGIYPIIGFSVKMCSGTSIIGNCNIGNNVILGAGTLVKDQDIPSNSIVFGSSPNLIIKQKK